VTEGFVDSNKSGVLQVCLIDGVAHYEHVIDANSNEQERNESVHSCVLSSTNVHEAKARCVGQNDADETD